MGLQGTLTHFLTANGIDWMCTKTFTAQQLGTCISDDMPDSQAVKTHLYNKLSTVAFCCRLLPRLNFSTQAAV